MKGHEVPIPGLLGIVLEANPALGPVEGTAETRTVKQKNDLIKSCFSKWPNWLMRFRFFSHAFYPALNYVWQNING